MRLELLLVVGDPGIGKHMPDVLNQGLEFTALLQAGPPELIEAAHLIHRSRKIWRSWKGACCFARNPIPVQAAGLSLQGR